MKQTPAFDGFCQTCPDPQEVTNALEPLGLSLHFQLDAQHSYNLPDLPAQYHYRDVHGTEVMFLAGTDHPEVGTRFPAHQSRWWVICGSSPFAFNLVAQELASRWGIPWQDDQEMDTHSVA
ncbi:hypothetical protein [Dictyobacter aurantiacus]|uniref:Uncharacterized protein n=1 Tax=Dictyobacter aurantiacus TaxID=1936993 RepID=A0A401ZDK3_9CHLR|nr:hypothetical protein [Dictyobacter aurantiacus]GCE04778.1 hypothetical protein KDAU_21070 [Dictyobacter aurantiacus]